MKGVDRSHKGKPAPEATFKDPVGGDISLADFEGVPTLVNLWATWCAPCVKELPTLDKPPPTGSAAPPLPAGTDPEPVSNETGPATPQ